MLRFVIVAVTVAVAPLAIDAGAMLTLKLSHASPWPSPSLSAWPVLATVGQLSTGSSTVSPSVSTISTWTCASM